MLSGVLDVQDPAWATAQLLLFAPEAPLEAKLFGAQTFRTKVSFRQSKYQ
jgi:transportin-3